MVKFCIMGNDHVQDIFCIQFWECLGKCLVYSQTCIKRSSLGQRKSGLLLFKKRKRFNTYDMTRKRFPFNTGDCLIEVNA